MTRTLPAFILGTPWVWIVLPALAVLGLYSPQVPSMVWEWSQFPTLSHGFAVLPIAVYLIWARRDRLRHCRLEPSLTGLPILVAGLAMLVIGVRGDESFIARVSLPIILLGLTLFLAGWEILGQVWIGIAYLFFMVPLPWATLKALMYQSRLLDAAASARILEWIGVPVYRDGTVLRLPGIDLHVVDDCSSIPALAALLALGVGYSSLVSRPAWMRALLVFTTLPLAIVSNIIRITATAATVYQSGPWILHSIYHQLTGTTNFLITFLLLLGLDQALCQRRRVWP